MTDLSKLLEGVTELPWRLEECSHGGAILKRGGFEHPQSHIQIVPLADARCIVTAANSFPALVRALTVIRDDIQQALNEHEMLSQISTYPGKAEEKIQVDIAKCRLAMIDAALQSASAIEGASRQQKE